MKKTIRINISGLIFNIDEDAYDKLQKYLASITKKFINTEEGNEIIADVETRIAELFQERIGDRKEVINTYDVDHVVEIMGHPEEFEDESDDENEEEEPQHKKTGRRIYRDTENRVISGLSAGVAAYFGTDPVIVRVIFVLMALFYGTSIFIYILLWIIIPEAKTRSQKLQMKGKDINLSNIETSIKTEFNNVKANFDNWQKSGKLDKVKTNIGDVLRSFGKVFGVFGKIVLIIIGICFLISGVAALGSITGVFFFNDTFLSPFQWNDIPFSVYEFSSLFTDSFTARVGVAASYLVLLIPILMLIYWGLKFIFRFRTKSRFLGVTAGALWVVSIIVLISTGVKIGYEMREYEEFEKNHTLKPASSDTLYIKTFNKQSTNYYSSNTAFFHDIFVDYDDGRISLAGHPRLNIERNNSQTTELSIFKDAKGKNKAEAGKFARNIKYEWQQDDSVIYFNKYFSIGQDKKIKDQGVRAVLKLPVGQIIYLDGGIDEISHYINNTQDYDSFQMTGQYWMMTENGLALLSEYKNMENQEKNIEIQKSEPKKKEGNIKDEIEAMKKELENM